MGSAIRGLNDSLNARLAARSDQCIVEVSIETSLQATVVVEGSDQDVVLVHVMQRAVHAGHGLHVA